MMKIWPRVALAALAIVLLRAEWAFGAAAGPTTAGQLSQEEIERLKKENEELRQRLDRLAGEMDEIKAHLAGKGAPLSSTTSTQKPVSSLGVEFYGYVKVDAAYDTSRVSVGDYARWVESEQLNRNDDEFNLTANETRVGLRLRGPESERFRSSSQVEIDFYGGGAENSASPRLRQANVTLEWPHLGLGVLGGQANDVISPLWMPRVNFSPGWWQGNIGFRRPQIRLTKSFSLSEDVELKLEAAAVRTIGETFTTPRDSFFDPGADAGFPTVQGRVSLRFPGLGRLPTTIGFSGHWGEEEHDFTNFTHSVQTRTRSANMDVTLPFTPWFKLQGEGYLGYDLDAYLGGIGQGIDGKLVEPIYDRGGWAAATFGPFGRWLFNMGYGIDSVRKSDVSAYPNPAADSRIENWVAFGNAYYSLNANLQLALELSRMRTAYKSAASGNDWRTQFAIIYKF